MKYVFLEVMLVFMLNYLSVQILYIYLNIIDVRKNINERWNAYFYIKIGI